MRMLMMELDTKTCPRLALIVTYLESSGMLRKISRCAVTNEVIQGKTKVDEAIEEQRNITTHFKYAQRMMFNYQGILLLSRRRLRQCLETVEGLHQNLAL